MSETETYHSEFDDELQVYGTPGEHALFARTFSDSSEPYTWSFNGNEEIEWAIEQLQQLKESNGDDSHE